MRILFALAYGPGPTRIRSRMILKRLCARHEVTLVCLAWDDSDYQVLAEWAPRLKDLHVIPHERGRQIQGLLGNPTRPVQQMVSTSPAFAQRIRAVIDEAAAAGCPYDVVHVEHFRGAVAADLFRGLSAHVVYDAVDCLAFLAEQTQAFGTNPLVRLIAGVERERTRRAEDRLLDAVDTISVVAERDREAMVRNRLIEGVVVIPNGVEHRLSSLDDLPDSPYAIFTGKLSYHANQAALKWLLNDVWPLVLADVPSARLTIAGADPPNWIRRAAKRRSVRLIANPLHMEPVLSRARVAVAPVIYSVGIQNKVLEAMAAGRPVVATGSAADGLGNDAASGIALADTPGKFATEIVRLFLDDGYANSIRRKGFQYVLKNHDWDSVVQKFERLYQPEIVSAQVA